MLGWAVTLAAVALFFAIPTFGTRDMFYGEMLGIFDVGLVLWAGGLMRRRL